MSHGPAETPTLYGLMAEFENPTALVEATTRARLDGYRAMDAFTPIPIHELDEALGLRRTRLPRLVLLGGILGGTGGFSLEYWASTIAYPMNVGARRSTAGRSSFRSPSRPRCSARRSPA